MHPDRRLRPIRLVTFLEVRLLSVHTNSGLSYIQSTLNFGTPIGITTSLRQLRSESFTYEILFAQLPLAA
jgi:hypothetical protein